MKITDELVLEFERADFGVDELTHLGQMVMINGILRKEMLKWVEFRGETDDGGYEVLKCPPHNYPTHRVRLMPPQKIQQKECKHYEVQIYDLQMGNPAFRCLSCKKPVQPKNGWEAV